MITPRTQRTALAVLIGTVLGLVLLLTAHAASYIVSDGIDETYLPIDDTVNVPQFDPARGILTEVGVRFVSVISGSFSFGNPIPITQTLAGEIQGIATISVPKASLLIAQEILSVVTETLAPDVHGTITFSEPISAQMSITDPAVLPLFQGAGNVALPVTVGAGWRAGGNNPNIDISILSRGNLLAEVEYKYAVPEITLDKFTNGAAADAPDDADVPQLMPGDAITWTYLVTNTGVISLAQADIVVTDSQPGITPQRDEASDDGDGLLAPQETWRYTATGRAVDLIDADAIVGLRVVAGCRDDFGTRATYANTGRVVVPGASAQDDSHYCNPAQAGLVVEKVTNGVSAAAASGPNVPELPPGTPIVWSYIVTNTGNVTFTPAQITVTDSDPNVTPARDPDSDDGDGLLAPGETWIYRAAGAAVDLIDAEATEDLEIVEGCADAQYTAARATYTNIGRVTFPGGETDDSSYYCNTAEPGIDLEKLTNGFDADAADDPDVPRLVPGEPVQWDYRVTNTGNVPFTSAQVSVVDSAAGVTPALSASSDDGDGLLSPGETWVYVATGSALELDDPVATAGVTVIDGCSTVEDGVLVPQPTYRNTGTVTVPGATDADDSHYCNLRAPTALTLVSFGAFTDASSIALVWRTAAEVRTAGFHLLRATSDARSEAVRLTTGMIPAQGSASDQLVATYRVVDTAVVPGIIYTYWLEEVEIGGRTITYGPLRAQTVDPAAQMRAFLPLVAAQ